MKNQRMVMAVLAALLVLPVTEAASQTSAEQAECQLVLNSAQNGRANAVNRISTIEAAVKDQVANARSCLERFGDMASRQTVMLGGVDVTPIRDAIFARACSVIQGNIHQVTSQYTEVLNQAASQVPSLGGQPASQAGRVVGPGAGQGTPGIQPQSFWDRMSCAVLGNCY